MSAQELPATTATESVERPAPSEAQTAAARRHPPQAPGPHRRRIPAASRGWMRAWSSPSTSTRDSAPPCTATRPAPTPAARAHRPDPARTHQRLGRRRWRALFFDPATSRPGSVPVRPQKRSPRQHRPPLRRSCPTPHPCSPSESTSPSGPSAPPSDARRVSPPGPAAPSARRSARRLRGMNVDPDSVIWDAWRREDGRWSLTAALHRGRHGRPGAADLRPARQLRAARQRRGPLAGR